MPKDNETLRQSCKKMKPGVMDMRAADVGLLKMQRNAEKNSARVVFCAHKHRILKK